jgi:hypothetical protein
VKEDDSLKLTRSQDSVWRKVTLYVAGYYWKYLVEKRNCELAAIIGIFFYIDFFFIFILFSFIRFYFHCEDFWS